MCKQCDEALLAAASAANLLATAAQTLYSMNDHTNSAVLANAAGDLFKPVKQDTDNAASSNAGTASSKGEGSTDIHAEARAEINSQLPEGMQIGDDGLIYLNGKAVGEAVLIRRPTRH